MTRRQFMQAGASTLSAAALGTAGCATFTRRGDLHIATFEADVTPPIGHALMGGGVEAAKTIADRLFARGFVLLGFDQPIVFVSIEWCEIRNDAFAAWRRALAAAAGTDPRRVIVSCVHVHDAPIADLTAERMLRTRDKFLPRVLKRHSLPNRR